MDLNIICFETQATTNAAAAWQWLLHTYQAGPAAAANIRYGWLSLLVQRNVVVRHKATGKLALAFGNAVWAFFAWPLEVVTVGSGASPRHIYRLALNAGSHPEVGFITGLEEVEVLPCYPAAPCQLLSLGVPPPVAYLAWVQDGCPESLLAHALRSGASITVSHVRDLLDLLNVPYKKTKLKACLLELLIRHVFSESEGESQKILDMYASTKTQADLDEALALDPEVSAVWHEMGDEMKDDFKEVSSAMDRLNAKAKASRARSSHTQAAQSAKFGLRPLLLVVSSSCGQVAGSCG